MRLNNVCFSRIAPADGSVTSRFSLRRSEVKHALRRHALVSPAGRLLELLELVVLPPAAGLLSLLPMNSFIIFLFATPRSPHIDQASAPLTVAVAKSHAAAIGSRFLATGSIVRSAMNGQVGGG